MLFGCCSGVTTANAFTIKTHFLCASCLIQERYVFFKKQELSGWK